MKILLFQDKQLNFLYQHYYAKLLDIINQRFHYENLLKV